MKGDFEIGWTYGVHAENRNARRALVGNPPPPPKKKNFKKFGEKK